MRYPNILNAAVVIGFINAPYEELENASSIRVTFGVITGSLQEEVVVVLSFSDGIATSKLLKPFTVSQFSLFCAL